MHGPAVDHDARLEAADRFAVELGDLAGLQVLALVALEIRAERGDALQGNAHALLQHLLAAKTPFDLQQAHGVTQRFRLARFALEHADQRLDAHPQVGLLAENARDVVGLEGEQAVKARGGRETRPGAVAGRLADQFGGLEQAGEGEGAVAHERGASMVSMMPPPRHSSPS